ncbi:hypothetical protein BJY01DRAFT_89829 [Aspergillus pseudoustus]|uniref:Uncharacterized protein n=1 Tax=Aspergillus pseudoustus TaxID=1810923 RepID=A0ABR4J4D4_9EURO
MLNHSKPRSISTLNMSRTRDGSYTRTNSQRDGPNVSELQSIVQFTMHLSQPWPQLGLAIATAIVAPVAGQLCEIGDYHISRQEELDDLIQDYTALEGQITLSHDYTGSLVFHNVTNITSSSITSLSTSEDSGVTSIELPDLVTADSLTISGVTTLEKLSFPKLEYVEHLVLLVVCDGKRAGISFAQ